MCCVQKPCVQKHDHVESEQRRGPHQWLHLPSPPCFFILRYCQMVFGGFILFDLVVVLFTHGSEPGASYILGKYSSPGYINPHPPSPAKCFCQAMPTKNAEGKLLAGGGRGLHFLIFLFLILNQHHLDSLSCSRRTSGKFEVNFLFLELTKVILSKSMEEMVGELCLALLRITCFCYVRLGH